MNVVCGGPVVWWGFAVNVKVVERIYREVRLTPRRRPRNRMPKGSRKGAWCPIAAIQRRSLDFSQDALANGRKFRTTDLKDDCARECPAIESPSQSRGCVWWKCWSGLRTSVTTPMF